MNTASRLSEMPAGLFHAFLVTTKLIGLVAISICYDKMRRTENVDQKETKLHHVTSGHVDHAFHLLT